MTSQEEKRRIMLNDSVDLLVCRMAVPTIITMMITALYNMADTYFVGKLDTISTAAVGIALPMMNVIQAMGFFFGHGSGNYISQKLGEGNTDSAEKMADTAAVMSFACGLVLMAVTMIFITPVTVLLGATPLLMESSVKYISVLAIGIPFVMTSFTMNNQLRFRGEAFRGMIGMATGSVLNVILDPIMIFVLNMGVRGAALATIISQIVSFMILLKMSGRLALKKPNVHFSMEIISAIIRFGTPSLCRQSIMSIAAVCMNNMAGVYGEAVIAAVSVVNKIVMLGCSVIIGFGQGFQPVCGFNMGAKRFDRVRKTYLFCIRAATVFMTCFGVITFIFAPQLIAFFRDDPDVVSAGILILRGQSFTVPLQGVVIMTNMLMQNLGKTFIASFLAIARQGVFFIPLLYILCGIYGLFGLQITQAAADMLTTVITIPIAIKIAADLKKRSEEAALSKE